MPCALDPPAFSEASMPQVAWKAELSGTRSISDVPNKDKRQTVLDSVRPMWPLSNGGVGWQIPIRTEIDFFFFFCHPFQWNSKSSNLIFGMNSLLRFFLVNPVW